jgi:hypothetical protein
MSSLATSARVRGSHIQRCATHRLRTFSTPLKRTPVSTTALTSGLQRHSGCAVVVAVVFMGKSNGQSSKRCMLRTCREMSSPYSGGPLQMDGLATPSMYPR